MTEQSGPKQLMNYAVKAERLGFDFEVSSDHYSPWLTSQGHAPYAWSILGAVAHATERVELATYVTCPTLRYHPAVIAQKAATMQLLADGRFILGLGSGENLNEHVISESWPTVAQRQDMLTEAITIIRQLHTGELVTWQGDYFRIDSARIWDLPDGGGADRGCRLGRQVDRPIRPARRSSHHHRARSRLARWVGEGARRAIPLHRPDPDLLGTG